MVEDLQSFMLEKLKDIYDGEQQAAKALPRLAKAVSTPDVRKAFVDHVEQTKKQIQRIEEIFSKMGEEAQGKPCKGMEGLVAEAEEHLSEEMPDEFRDAALVGAEQKVEHYEIAAYEGAIEMAETMGNRHAARLLRQNLTEEERMSRKLTQISSRWVKKAARDEQRREREAA